MTILAVLFLLLTWSAVFGLVWLSARATRASAAVPVPPETVEAGRRAVRRGTWIAAAITGFVALCVAGLVALGADHAAETVLRFAPFAAFHLVFWVGGAPLHRRNGETVAATRARQTTARRVASLVPRDEAPPVSRGALAVPWVLLAAALLAVAGIAFARGGLTPTSWTIVAVPLTLALAFAATHGLWIRAVGTTPQNLAGAPDPVALDDACRAFRRTLARGVLGMAVATAAVCGAIAVAGALYDGDPVTQNMIGAWGGGIGGSAIGIGGGVVGALADRRRRAILDLGGIPPEPGVRTASPRP